MTDHIPQFPWENFKEEDIQLLIEFFFQTEDYKVYNLHKIQRAIEGGADILISKKGFGTAAVAVKINPKKSDAYQLIELSRRTEKKKWYIYIGDPTPSFLEEMNKTGSCVNFLGKNSLNSLLYKINPELYIDLLLDNMSFVKSLIKIQYLLLSFHLEQKKGKAEKEEFNLDKESLNYLWRLKDDTASLNKIFLSLQLFFEDLEEKESSLKMSDDFIFSYFEILNYNERYCENISYFLKKFYNKNKSFFNYVIKETIIRSNWLGIACFRPVIPHNVESILNDRKNSEVSLKKFKNHLKEMGKKGKIDNNFTFDFEKISMVGLLGDYSRHLRIFLDSVEDVIDDLFSYGVFDKPPIDTRDNAPSDKKIPF